MGLNDVLINILCVCGRIICCRHGVFPRDKNGEVSVQIRFDIAKDAPSHDVVGHYKRKPDQQVRCLHPMSNYLLCGLLIHFRLLFLPPKPSPFRQFFNPGHRHQ